MEIKNVNAYGFESAIRAVRMPMMSHSKSDSYYDENGLYVVGNNDMTLMQKLFKAGSPHAKFMRQITCSFTLTAPVYFMAEFDTYKVSVTRNSSSFMHKGLSKEFEFSDFEDAVSDDEWWQHTISELNGLRDYYKNTNDSSIFLEIRKKLPMSYLYTSEITCNYAVLANIIRYRHNHRLPQWRFFCQAMLNEMPFLKEIMYV